MSLVCRDNAIISQVPNMFRIASGASLAAQTVKTLPVTQEAGLCSLGGEDPLEKGTAAHASTLA